MNEDQFQQKIETYPGDKRRRSNKSHHVLTGLFILGIGAVLLMRQSGVDLPFWLFTWPVLLMGIGILGGLKTSFRPGGWMIVMAVGGIFFSRQAYSGNGYSKICVAFIDNGYWPLDHSKT